MTQTQYIDDVAHQFGLEGHVPGGEKELTLARHGLSVRLPASLLAHLDATTVVGRHLTWSVLLGVRLGLDHHLCGYHPSMERADAQAIYGERLPRLVPPATIAWFGAIAGAPALRRDWLVDELKLVYVLGIGKYLHTLTLPEMATLPLSAEKTCADARHALFYDAYKLKPAQKLAVDGGEIRVFRTTEGLGATRALLLPDFDYDAAREAGSFALPCRDTLLIGRPRACDQADEVLAEVARLSARMLQEAALPLSEAVFQLSHNRAFAAPGVLDAAPHGRQLQGLPSYADLIKAVLPAEEIPIERGTRF